MMESGKTYRIVHRRKGEFVAQFVRIDPRDDDETMWVVRYDTRRGTGQERLARAAKAEWTETALRPSLIVSVELIPDGDWRITPKPFVIPPEAIPHKPRPWYAGVRRWTIKHLQFDPVKALQNVNPIVLVWIIAAVVFLSVIVLGILGAWG